MNGKKASALKLLQEALMLDPLLPIARTQYRELTGKNPVYTLHGLSH